MTHDKGKLEVVTSIAEKLPSLTDWAEEGDGPLRPLLAMAVVLGALAFLLDYQFHILQLI